jgi:hypothetical protein
MRRWPIIEKEAYAVVASCDRLDWLLQGSAGFSLFTDHHNLLYVFNPNGQHGATSAHSAAKLIRWALKLSTYRYTIEHVAGVDNVWSDMLTRWAAPTALVRASALLLAPISPSLDESFTWPTARDIRIIQEAMSVAAGGNQNGSRPPLVELAEDGLYRTAEGRVWIPDAATNLQLRICIVAHTSLGGHRGYRTTKDSIKALFFWTDLSADVRTFCNSCLHCCSTSSGDRTPRPFGQALHASLPNEIIHFDYLYMGPSAAGYKYLLIIKDDLSGYLWLVPSIAADTAATVDALSTWFAAFGIAAVWVSDQGSHFKNQVMESLRKSLRTQHHFTTAYTPWANGTVERACREVLRAARALLSEFRLPPDQWPDVARIIQSSLNNSPSPQRGNIAPITAFTGRNPDSPLLSLLSVLTGQSLSLDAARALQLLKIQELRAAVDEIHKTARESADSNRAAARAHHARPHVQHANFELGDFVLVAKRAFRGGEKLSLRWHGPHRIVSTRSEYVYDVEDLMTQLVLPVHATRLRFYHDSSLLVTADIREHLAHQNKGYEVQKFLSLRYDAEAKAHFVLVSWLGFEDLDDTWEPLATLYEDLPTDILSFLHAYPDQVLSGRAQRSLPT